MKKSFETVTLALVSLLILPAVSGAETLAYSHDGKPLLSITFPDGWLVDTDYVEDATAAGTYKGGEPEIRIVEAMPEDGTRLWIGSWVAPRTSTLEKGLEYAASLDGSLFTDVEATAPEATEVGGMAARTFHGTAKRQGEDVEFAMALLEPRDGVIVVVLYVGEPETWTQHEAELTAIVESLRPAGG